MKQRELVGKVIRNPVHWPAFGFGLGLIPFAPGTFGSLLAIPLWWATPRVLWIQLAVAVVIFTFGVWVCGASARRLGIHDHGGIVWDEVVGMYITLLVIPLEPLWILASFGLFRLFDIWKPWPIRDLDHRLRGGLGIMLDDVIAGLYAACLLLFSRILW